MSNAQPLILTVDDDPDLAAIVCAHVESWGYEAQSVGSASALWQCLGDREPAAMLMDVMLGDADGSHLIAEVKQQLPNLPIIMVTRSRSVEAAVRCMKHGATEYITKPIDFAQLRRCLREAVEIGRLARDLRSPPPARPKRAFHGLIGGSPPMLRLYDLIEKVASAEVSALILGETGSGKELVARAIHEISRRRDMPFVAVNAAAIPRELVESELFGHEKGAFTGASRRHVGTCERADRGTLFLDEIGEMELDVQAKMLRFLQDHEVRRVGGRNAVAVDVRVLAASNREPLRQIAEGRLREDLYYRLRVVSLALPPLRERPGDLPLLTQHFLAQAAARHGRGFTGVSAAALDRLEQYSWPGNVRQLKNVIEEAVVLNDGERLTPEMLPEGLRDGTPGQARTISEPRAELSARETAERRAIAEALAQTDGNAEAAARLLGSSRATIYRRIRKYGLSTS